MTLALQANSRGSNPRRRTSVNNLMSRGRKPNWISELASQRMGKLLLLAKTNSKEHPERSRRYVELAGLISQRYNVRMSSEQKSLFCKRCCTYFTSDGVKNRVVPKTKTVVQICVFCGFKRIYGNKHEKIERKGA